MQSLCSVVIVSIQDLSGLATDSLLLLNHIYLCESLMVFAQDFLLELNQQEVQIFESLFYTALK